MYKLQRNNLPFWSPSFLRFGVFLWGVSKYLPHVITVHEQGKSKDENGKGCVKPKRDLEQYVFKPLEKTGDGKKRGKIKVKHRQKKRQTLKNTCNYYEILMY